MTERNLADLEDVLRTTRILVDGIHVVSDPSKLARMIEGKLGQGETVEEATVSSINFYASYSCRKQITPQTAGVAELMRHVERWWNTAPPIDDFSRLTSEEQQQRRDRVTTVVKKLFERGYAGSYEGDWLDVDTSGFDLDPVGYLEQIASAFAVALPPYGTNREIIEFVVVRWRP